MPRPAFLGILARRATIAIRVAAAMMRRPTRGDLGRMDDRMLRDIGLMRQDLWGFAAEPLFRDPGIRQTSRADGHRPAVRARAQAQARGLNDAGRLWAEENRLA